MFPRGRNQDVTYWAATPNGLSGYTFAAPEVVKGFWIDKAEMFYTSNGEELRSKSVCYVTIALSEDGYLFLGSSAVTDPTTLAAARQIKAINAVTDVRSASNVTKAYLR